MESNMLARVDWQLGQTLLPEHLRAQEDALLAELRVTADLVGLPRTGVARLEWDAAQLAAGTLSVSRLVAVLPGGALVHVPGNAVIESSLPLGAQGKERRVSVYLHLLDESYDGSLLAGGGGVVDLPGGDPARDVPRVIRVVRLSVDRAAEGAPISLKLAEVEQDLNGQWQLGPFLPRLLAVGPNPFLAARLLALRQALAGFHTYVASELGDHTITRGRAAVVRRCQLAAYRIRALLDDIDAGVHPHPYALFASLRDFLLEVLAYHEQDPGGPLPAYNHDDLAAGLDALLVKLRPRLRGQYTRSRHERFVRKEALYVLSPLPEEALGAAKVYVLVSRPSGGAGSLEGVKIAAPGRLPNVHQLARRGIPYARVEPDFRHSFGADVAFYLLEQGDEWKHAVRESGLAFRAIPSLEGADLSLFWRSE